MPALWHNISYDKPAGAHLRRNPDAPAGNLARGGAP
jgi:hypothetical protein